MKYEESRHQTVFVRWFKGYFPQYQYLIMSLPNGQNVGPRIGQRLKDMGQLKGAPDLFLAIPRNGFHGLFIEMKASKGRATPEQKQVHAHLKEQGYAVHICYSDDEAVAVTSEYLLVAPKP
jgi:hypothetical protein